MTNLNPQQLTEREMLIAKRAAQMAVEEMTAQFYQQVGKTVIQRALIFIGAMAIGFGMAKGWINFTPPK